MTHRSTAMFNLYTAVQMNPAVRKLTIGDLVFAQYTCPIGYSRQPVWNHMDHLIHVTSGRKTWHTSDGVWEGNAGDTLFFRKGASILEQFFDDDFCVLAFFMPDHLVRSTALELMENLDGTSSAATTWPTVFRMRNDVALNGFFGSMHAYFAGPEKPPEALLQLKAKELIVGILTSGENAVLSGYFRSMVGQRAPDLAAIMDANFRFNLSLEEYAKLSHRSLSSFKRDFHAQYGTAPGGWLVSRRLEYASHLFRSTALSVTEISLESGFKDVSHFSRAFKSHFGVPPKNYRDTPAEGKVARAAK